MDFCLLPKIWVENVGKNISKKLSNKYSQKRIDYAEQSATEALKSLQKERLKKQQKQLVIYFEIKLLIKL